MKEFRELSPEEKVLEPIRMIGKEWMLIGAKKPTGEMNAMTASWGGIGVLFHKPVVFCFVRPQRYTDEFLQASGYATCSFLPESYRPALTVMGRTSGREGDKFKKAGLTPIPLEDSMTVEEAKTVLYLKKLYTDRLCRKGFEEEKLYKEVYPQDDLHHVYIYEILKVYEGGEEKLV